MLWDKLAEQVFRYFQEPILWAPFLCLLISRKALKWWQLLMTSRNLLQKKKKICACFHISPSAQSHIYWPSPYLFGIVSQGYLRYCLPGYSPHILPQIKLPSHSHTVLFLSWQLRLPYHPVTSPSTNQMTVHELTMHPVTLSLSFRNPSPKATGEFRSCEQGTWHPTLTGYLPPPQYRGGGSALLHIGQVDPSLLVQ